MSEIATLSLKKETRPSVRFDTGAYKTERTFLDFVVNGVSLWSVCTQAGMDNISCLWLPVLQKTPIQRLLLLEPPDLPHDRYSLYVCAECGDLGCGAVSIQIEQREDIIIWSNFSHQNNYDKAPPWVLEEFAHLDSVSFNLTEYRQLLIPLLS